MKNSMILSIVFFVLYCEDSLFCMEINPRVRSIPVYEDAECKGVRGIVSIGDVERLARFHPHPTKQEKCLLACIMKKSNAMSQDGQYDQDTAHYIVDKLMAPHPQLLEQAHHIVDICSGAVEGIEDDERGCEVAGSLYSCFSHIYHSEMASKSEEYNYW